MIIAFALAIVGTVVLGSLELASRCAAHHGAATAAHASTR